MTDQPGQYPPCTLDGMRFIGVDLAWKPRGWTGLCVVEHGRAVESTLLRSDDELLSWLRPRTREPCIVAFDAPLIIPNETGARGCDREITRLFGRYEAGCYPANRTRVPPRALCLATELGLDPDPELPTGDTRVRRALEVYPHAALVTLFDLDRTIKYKARKGRSLAGRRAAFTDLTARLETLDAHDPPLHVQAAPRWAGLVSTATGSPVGAELDRVEDEIDAFVCAYVALLLWTYGTGCSRVVGSLTDGYIVTPISRAGHASSSTRAPLQTATRSSAWHQDTSSGQ